MVGASIFISKLIFFARFTCIFNSSLLNFHCGACIFFSKLQLFIALPCFSFAHWHDGATYTPLICAVQTVMHSLDVLSPCIFLCYHCNNAIAMRTCFQFQPSHFNTALPLQCLHFLLSLLGIGLLFSSTNHCCVAIVMNCRSISG